MAPTIRNTQTAFAASGSTNTIVNVPTGLAVGDLMLGWNAGEADNTALGAPTATGTWTSQRAIVGGLTNNYPACTLWSKVAVAADVSASTYTFTDAGSSGGDGTIILMAITAGTYDTTTPINFSDASIFSQARTSNNVQTARSMTGVNDGLLLALLATDTNNVSQSYPSSGPASMTLVASRNSATLYSLGGVYSQVLATTGTVGGGTVTPSGAIGVNGWCALSIIVRPAPVTAKAPPPSRIVDRYRHLLLR